MSLYYGNDDGLHIERINAEAMRKRGYFINVAPTVKDDYGGTQSEHHQAPRAWDRLRNNLNISPGEYGREAFSQTSSRVRDNRRERKNFAITFKLCKLQIIFLQHIIFDCLKPIYNFLRALGVFPLSRNENGEFYFLVRSPAMVYSFTVFVVLIVNMQLRLNPCH